MLNTDKRTTTFFNVLLLLFFLATASLIGSLFRQLGFPETNIVSVYLLAVLLTAWRIEGSFYGILASVLATIFFNYFFTEPYYTFSVNDPSYIITFLIMTSTSIITSTLTALVKRSALSAQEKEAETKSLFQLTNLLSDAKDISSVAVTAISETFACQAALLSFQEDGKPESSFIQQISPTEQIHRQVADSLAIMQRIEGLRTENVDDEEFTNWPIYGSETLLAMVRIPTAQARQMSISQRNLLHSMIETIAMAMDRHRSQEQRLKSTEEAMQERFRGNLLRSISHDLRTPLSGIIGTSEMLLDILGPQHHCYPLAQGIHQDAEWLHSLVENIMSLTRLQDGKLVLNRQMEAVEEIIGSALTHLAKHAPHHKIVTRLPNELLLLPVDGKLIEQVLINLLENAAKHTLPNKPICLEVEVQPNNKEAVFTVKDSGTGIPPLDLPHIFQLFYTSRFGSHSSKQGMGLGLVICETIVKAHGGTISARNRTDGTGAVFTFTLPLEVESNDGE